MTIERDEDLAGLTRVCAVVRDVLAQLQTLARPGMRTRELDAVAADLLQAAGAKPAPALTYGFPGAVCISVGNVVAHGVPNGQRMRAGDLVNIDVSAELEGYFGDTGASFVIGSAAPWQQRLLDATRQARDAAIAVLRPGGLLNTIGRAVERVANAHRLRVVHNLGSHGVGRALHEAPDHIPAWFDPRDTRRLHEGQVITIEPFLATDVNQVTDASDGWGLYCRRGHAAQFEHTVVVQNGGALVLT